MWKINNYIAWKSEINYTLQYLKMPTKYWYMAFKDLKHKGILVIYTESCEITIIEVHHWMCIVSIKVSKVANSLTCMTINIVHFL